MFFRQHQSSETSKRSTENRDRRQRDTAIGRRPLRFEQLEGKILLSVTVSGFSESIANNTTLPFATGEFTAHFSDTSNPGASLQDIKIATLPAEGTLTLGSTAHCRPNHPFRRRVQPGLHALFGLCRR